MIKSIISILFTSLFLLFLMAPTIISMVDDSIDISIFYTNSEEEEKGCKKNTEKEFFYYEINTADLDFTLNDNNDNAEYYIKKYFNPHLKLASPPPK